MNALSPLLNVISKITGKDILDISILIIAAHPDDEIIGTGAIMMFHKNTTLLHITDGAPRDMADACKAGFLSREQYRECRYKELRSILETCNIAPEQSLQLNIEDKNTAYNLQTIILKIYEIFRFLKPDVIMTHAYDGGHPDHDSAAFCTRAAHFVYKMESKYNPPIIEFATYRGENNQQLFFNFIPYSNKPVFTVSFNKEEQIVKANMFKQYISQSVIVNRFPVSHEVYRFQPYYDFTLQPLTNFVLYDSFNWSINSTMWRQCVQDTLKSMDLTLNYV